MYNSKLEEFKKYVKGRKIAFLGIGISNIPTMKYLNRLGANITAFDKKDMNELGDICIELESLGIHLSLGENYLNSLIGFDLIFRSPSVRPDLPEILRETSMGTILTSEIEMVMEMCPGKIIGVTGSGGKTTTTTLIGLMLKEQGIDCYIGGNIGIPLFDKIDEMTENTIVVLELSSFQLMTMKISPHISVITSLSPDHLDIHKDLDEYYSAKENIFKYQNEDDILVLNYDNEIIRKFKDKTKSIIRYFSSKEKLTDGIMVDDKKIKIAENKIRKHILNVEDIKIIGTYNLMNLCAAILAVQNMVSMENIQKVATTFTGIEHRMQLAGEKNGVMYINNSIATSPIKSIVCLEDFKDKIILLAGGYDKNTNFDEFAQIVVEKVKILILFGQTKQKIKEAIERNIEQVNNDINIEIIKVNELEEAVNYAKNNAKAGDIVLLAPACASYDQFASYKDRGNKFKELVEKL